MLIAHGGSFVVLCCEVFMVFERTDFFPASRRLSDLPWVTFVMVAINVVVFFIIEATGSTEDTDYMIRMGGLYDPLVTQDHEYWRLITHFFLHFGPTHLFNNMISLLILGYATESTLGHIKYFFLYFFSGILAGVVTIVYNMYLGAEGNVSCGASGAIFGLSGALLVILIRRNIGRRSTEVLRYLIFMGLSLYSGYLDPSISFSAHAGGFVAGALLCVLMTLGKSGGKSKYAS